MKNKRIIGFAVATVLAVGVTGICYAADESEVKDGKAKRNELREKFKNMSPEERRTAMKEWREKNLQQGGMSEDLRKRREEIKNLSPEEREAKRKEMRALLEKRVAELQKKKADGTLTEQEQPLLQRMENALKNRGRSQAAGKVRGEKPGGPTKAGDKTENKIIDAPATKPGD